MKKIERYEIFNIDPKVKEKIKVYCVKNKITAATWAEMAMKALIK